MATSVRNVPKLLVSALVTFLNALFADLAVAVLRSDNRALGNAALADGTTDGKIKTSANIAYSIAGTIYTKTATDDLWDLSGQTDTTAGQYRAYYLYLDSSGAASIGAGTNAASAAAAIAALPTIPATKAVIGTYVAGASTDFNGAAGLEAQGTLYAGYPGAYTATADTISVIAA